MELRNRIVMPAMVTQYGDRDGNVTERTKRYYEARARGGVGLIVVEATCVQQRGQILPNQLKIIDDRFIPGMHELVDRIHGHGAKAALQLHHGGRMARSEVGLAQPVAPSPLPIPEGEMPKGVGSIENNPHSLLIVDFIDDFFDLLKAIANLCSLSSRVF